MTGPLIIGGGPAGSSAAITLARAGQRPVLLDRSRETGDAICGGFLSWQSLARLRDLGLEPDEIGGHPVGEVRLFHRTRMAAAALPRPGIGISRRTLDTMLLDAAARAGAGIERGVRASSMDSHSVGTAGGAQVTGAAVILATGKTAMTGQVRRPPAPASIDPVVGLRLRMAPHPGHVRLIGSAVELFLFDRGYAGLVIQEDGSANLCLAVHKSRLTESGGRPERLIMDWAGECPPLADRLAVCGTLPRTDAIAAIPYGWMADRASAGVWRIGDQLACIPSLAGEGMGIALWSGMTAARFSLRGETADSWQGHAVAQLRRPMQVARWAWHLAESGRWTGAGIAVSRHAPWLIQTAARLTRVPA